MSIVYHPPSAPAKPKATVSIRMRLLVLALIAIVPLMVDRARLIEAGRAERIAALSEEVRALAAWKPRASITSASSKPSAAAGSS